MDRVYKSGRIIQGRQLRSINVNNEPCIGNGTKHLDALPYRAKGKQSDSCDKYLSCRKLTRLVRHPRTVQACFEGVLHA